MERRAQPRRRVLVEEIEPRILYSADFAPAGLDTPVLTPATEQRTLDPSGEFNSDATFDSRPRRHELVFVDSRAAGEGELIRGLRDSDDREIEVVLLESDRDGVEQISEALAERSDVDAVHILSHGEPGAVQLGSTTLNFDSLLANATRIRTWGDALSEQADLLIYGCDVAASPEGRSLLEALSRLTGADVAASDDPTGAQNLGGDWDLEFELGLLETSVAVDTAVQTQFASLLDLSTADATATTPITVSAPLAFEVNAGQTDANVDFTARGSGYTVWLTDGDAVIGLQNETGGYAVRLDLRGANDDAAASGENLLEAKSNYLVGAEDVWRQSVANYGAVRYDEVYAGIDLRYYGNEHQLEYDFVVEAGADTSAIRLGFDGAQNISIDADGNLILTLGESGQPLAFKAPIAYQDGPNGREAVDSRYVQLEDGSVGFEVGTYDASRELVIDPILSYGTYLGGSGGEQIWNMELDPAGNVYVTGYTNSTNFPATTGAFAGTNDIFVSKFSPDLGTLVYSTYIGGSGDDQGYGLAVDAAGNAYVSGYTTSTNFALVAPYDSTLSGGQDAFLLKLNASGSSLLFSTLLGGAGADIGYGVAVDSAGSAYVSGYTDNATGFPLLGAFDASFGGTTEAFVTKFSPTGSTLVYSTFLGGSGFDAVYNVEVTAAGNAVVVGESTSVTFTTTLPGAYQAANGSTGNKSDAFVAMVNAAGTGLVYGTFLGGSNDDFGYAVALDPGGKIYIGGDTSSNNFDVTASAMQGTKSGGADSFVAVIDPTATGAASLVYSTHVGGGGTESLWGIDVDSAGRIYAAGYTTSTNLTVTGNAYQSANAGGEDIFVLVLDPTVSGAAGRVYASYLGGGNADDAWAASYANGKFYVAGNTASASGITPSGYDTSFNGGFDGYVAAFSIETPPVVKTSAGVLAYAESAGPLAVDLDLTVVDDDSTSLASATVRITGNYINGEDLLAFNNANPWGITGTWASATGTLTLTGVSSVSSYQAALRSVTYQNTSEKPSTLTRSVTFTASDGGLTSAAAVRQIAVSSLNDPAVNTVPGTQLGNEDSTVVFSAGNGNQISIADVDADTAPLQVTLTATNGRLTLAQISGLAFVSGDGSADASMTFTGTIANINSALNGLRFDPSANYNGPAAVQIATNDLGNSGTGGAQITNSTVTIDLSPVNDWPVQTVPGAQSTAQNTPLLFSTGTGNAIVVVDLDAGGGELKVTLTGTNGTLTLGSVAGLSSALGNGTSVVTITGGLTDLNAALDGLRFTPAFNYSGPASLVVATDDQGNSGSGGPRTDSDVIGITVSPNIIPTITMSAPPLAYAEGAPATPVDAGLALSDPDNPILNHASVRIVAGYVQGEDELSFVNQLGISGSWDAVTGTLLLTGATSPADYQTALRTVAFRNSSDNPSGTRTVSFVVNDGVADSAAATRGVVITPQNDAPIIIVPGSQTAREDTPLVFSPGTGNQIAIGDVDAGANPVRLSLASTNGTLSLLQTTGLTFVGGADGSASMSFTGTVSNINAALSGLRFVAAGDYVGPANVQVTVDDLGNTGGGPLGDSRTVLINVTSVNDAPAGTDRTVTTSEETAYVFSPADFGFTDPQDSPGDTLQAVKIAMLPGGGTLTNNAVPVTAGAFVSVASILAGELVYTPFANASGAGYATLGFQVQDSGGIADGGVDMDLVVRTLTINVAAVNDPPVNVVPGAQSTPLGTPLSFSSANGNAISVSDIDENGGGLGVTLTTANGTLTLATTAGLLGVAGNGTGSISFSGSPDAINDALDGLLFSSSAGFFGTGSLQIVTDDLGNTGSPGPLQATSTVAIDVTYAAPSATVNAAPLSYVENDPATPVDGGLSIAAGTLSAMSGTTVKITGNYANGQDLLNYNAGVLPGGVSAVWDAPTGALTFTGSATLAQYEALLRTVTYRNLSDSPGTAPRTITFTLDDGVSTVSASRQVGVTAVNDGPGVALPSSQNTAINTPRVLSTANSNAITVSDVDAGGNLLRVTLISSNGTSALATTSGLSFIAGVPANFSFQGSLTNINNALNGLTFTPNTNYTGTAQLQVLVDDLGNSGSGGAKQTNVLLSINVIYTPPNLTATGGALAYVENAPATPVDPGLTLVPGNVNPLTGAQARITGNYASGQDVLSYNAGALPGGVSANWNAGTGALVFSGNATAAAYEALLKSVTYQNTSDAPNILTRSVTFTANDGLGSDIAVKQITVTAVNDAPVAVAEAYTATEDTTLTVAASGVLANDTDAENSLSAVLIDGTANGLLVLNPDGSFVYTPLPDFTGADSFRYMASDGALVSNLVVVQIDVGPVNDPPSGLSLAGVPTPENLDTAGGYDVGTLSTADPDAGDLHTYTIASGADAGRFAIAGDRLLIDDGVLDFETKPSYQVTVRSTDAGGLFVDRNLTISVANLNEAPSVSAITNRTIGEGTSTGTIAFTIGDPETAAASLVVTAASNDQSRIPNANLVLAGTDGNRTIVVTPPTDAYGGPVTITLSVSDGVNTTLRNFDVTIDPVADHLVVVDTASDIKDGDTSSIDALLMNRGADGFISLREAILAANGSVNGGSPDQIRFNIAGAGLHTINLLSALPAITDAVVLDATTQSGFAGAPIIELNGAAAGAGANGLTLLGGNSIVRGLVINRFDGSGLLVGGTGGNLIQGNYIGLNAAGSADFGNAMYGIWITSASNQIGGTTTPDRNVISANDVDGIYIDSTSGNLVQGNYVGTNATATGAVGNGEDGIWLDSASGNTIGGTVAGARNIVSGNNWSGISLSGVGADNVIQGNYIGVNASGTGPLANLSHGISVAGANAAMIGGVAAGAGNTIAFNLQDGVAITGGVSHSVLGNSIYSNSGLGIDINDNGVTANDTGDTDLGTNLGMNFPVIYSAVVAAGNVTITGEARAGATVQFFKAAADASGFGEGQVLLGSAVVSGGTLGSVDPTARWFSVTFAAGSLGVGDRVTAAATDAGGNTSEFSANVVASGVAPGITVSPTSGLTTNEDGGTATFTIVLNTAPTANVTIALSSNDASEGTVAPGLLTFTISDWNIARTVTVTGVADLLSDGSVPYTIVIAAASSADPAYNGLDPADVSVVNLDGVNSAPINVVPAPQTTTQDTALVFSTGNANAISIGDIDAGTNPVQVTLAASQGTLTLADTAGLTFTSGDGDDDVAMTFTGTIAAINTALDGMSFMPDTLFAGSALLTIATDDLGGTGSGGAQTDSDDVVITVSDSNDAPDGVALSNSSLDENIDTSGGYTVGTLSASDIDAGDSHTYSIVGGSDGSFFSAAGDQLLLDDGVLDYEWQASYEVVVRATDAGGLWFDETFIIDINDIATTIAGGQSFSIDELAGNSSTVGTVAASGDTAVSFSIVSGDPSGAFTIDANGEITVDNDSVLDFEASASYTLTVEADDGTTVSAQTLIIYVADAAPSVPAGQSFAVSEAANDGDPLGVVFTDGDEPVSFAITAGNAGGVFSIDGFGEITVADASGIDYESGTSFTLTIQVGDGTSAILQDVSVDVGDENDTPPVVTGGQVFAVAENASNGVSLGTVAGTDVDTVGALDAWAIVSGNADAIFAIDSVTGELTIADNSNLDFETTSSYVLGITVMDGVNASGLQTIVVSIIDASENVVGPVGDADAGPDSVVEGAAAGTSVGLRATATDVDVTDTVIYILDDDAGGRFAIDSATGAVTVVNGLLLDREAAPSHDIVVRAQSSDGSSSVALFTIAIGDADEYDITPIVDSDVAADGVVENAAVGTLVGITVSASDADSTTNQITYSLDDDAGGRFAIDNLTGIVTVAGAIDYEATSSLDITVRAESADGSAQTRLFTVAVANVSDVPVGAVTDVDAASSQLPEDTVAGTAVGVTALAADPETADTVSYSLDDDAGGRFAIDSVTGVVTVAGTLDYEAAASHAIVVRATSSDASFSTATFTILVTNVNEGPTVSAIPSQWITEDGTTGALTFTISDPETAAGSLIVAASSSNSALIPNGNLVFGGSGGTRTITVTSVPNAYGAPVTITLSVSDGVNLVQQTFDVSVAAVADTPTVTGTTTNEDTQSASGLVVTRNPADGASVTHFKVTGINGGTLYQNDGATAIGDGAFITVAQAAAGLRFTPSPDSTANGSFDVQASTSSSDAGLGGAVQSAVIAVNPINDAPMLTLGASGSLPFHGSLTIGSGSLLAADVEQNAAQLTYTVTALPSAGTLTLGGAPLGVNGMFTQADVVNGLLRYTHTGGGGGTDGLTLTLTDGAGATVGPFSLSMLVAAPPPPPPAPPPAAPPPPAAAPEPTVAPADTGGSNPSDDGSSSQDNSGSQTSPAPKGEIVAELPADTLAPVANAAASRAAELRIVLADTGGGRTASSQLSSQGDAVQQFSVQGSVAGAAAMGAEATTIGISMATGPGLERFAPGSVEAVTSTLRNTEWVGELDHMRQQIDGKIEVEGNLVVSSVAVTGSLSVGYVIWLLRGGLLLSSLLSSMPAWHAVDPMPVLARGGDSDDEDGFEEDPLEKLFGKARDALLGGRSGKGAEAPEPTPVLPGESHTTIQAGTEGTEVTA